MARRANLLDVSAFLSASADRIRRELVPPVRAIALEAIEVFADAANVDVPDATDAAPVENALADLCFMAAGELRSLEARLESAGDRQDQLLIACEQLRRRVVAAVTAYERRVSPSAPATATVVDAAELAKAIAIRAAYARFRYSLPTHPGGDPGAVRRAVRGASLALATLVAEPAFRAARLSDRLLIKSLRMRTSDCNLGDSDLSPAAGLLSDLAACADLLRGVNLRHELVVHDTELINSTLAKAGGPMPPPILAGALSPLYGRDEELDDHLRRLARQGRSEPVYSVLERLQKEINR